jgi:transcriptional regulator with GAF, ATPase, and Fis domain
MSQHGEAPAASRTDPDVKVVVSLPLGQRQPGLVGCSKAIRAIECEVDCAARSDASVLITGETGVGKEAVARLIHDRSPRASTALVAVNCEGLPDVLVESELFGHMRGSFVGAYRDKPGLLEMSPNGSLFLDEVGELSLAMQAVVLRFLESGEIQRVGAGRAHANVNVRVIAATTRDFDAQIAAGLFREDLSSRLNGIRVTIPPLRERTEDIPLLVDHFLGSARGLRGARARTLSAAALSALIAYPWPGNVRELQNVVERMVLRATGPIVQPSEVPAEVFRSGADSRSLRKVP